MNTKDIFNFNRFGKYFVSDLKTCAANYGLSLLVTTVLLPVALYLITAGFRLLAYSTWYGPGISLRATAICVALICIVVQMPVKCYGGLTDKQYGSFWLTLPASRLEKFISMFLLTCIIVPIAGMGIFLGLDALLCSIDPTCGDSLAVGAANLVSGMTELNHLNFNMGAESIPIEDAETIKAVIKNITSPWLYVDEMFGITLPFLLGAIFFKKGKTAKTFIAIFAVSTIFSILFTPFTASIASELVTKSMGDPNAVLSIFENGIFKNLVLIDTISDTIVNVALLIGIWFRIKTLKH